MLQKSCVVLCAVQCFRPLPNRMATPTHEFLFQDFTQEDDDARTAWLNGNKRATSWMLKAAIRRKQLEDAIGFIPCNRMHNGVVCAKPYMVHTDGFCGWTCRHQREIYTHAISALQVLAPDI